jgi:hypothetical protein
MSISETLSSVMSPIRRARGQMQAPVPPLLTAPNQTARFTTRFGKLFESPRAWLHGARNDRYEKCQHTLGHLKSYRARINFRVALRPLLIYIDSHVPLSDQFNRPTSASIAERFSSKCPIEDLQIDFPPSPTPCSRQFLVDGASSAISRP